MMHDRDPWWITPYVWLLRREDRRPFKDVLRLLGRLDEIRWRLYHRFHPKHRYNVLRTGLPPGYYDLDMRIEYALVGEFIRWYEHRGEESFTISNNPLLRSTYEALKGVDVGMMSYDELTEHLVTIVTYRRKLWY